MIAACGSACTGPMQELPQAAIFLAGNKNGRL